MTDRAALVEKLCSAWGAPEHDKLCRMRATAAIDLIRDEVLEEAARVALDEYRRSSSGEEIAAAIRALKGENNDV